MKTYLAFSVALAGFSLLSSPLTFAKSHQAETFPQIVRIAYLEGDVRVSRGREGGAPKDADWEMAVANLPLEAGFSLATGAGRAEIEFEDASTLYLGPSSVLIFNDLESTDNVPLSELGLLTGTVTLAIHPQIKGEVFILRTPTDTMSVAYGQRGDMRVTAYMDATGVTPLVGGFIQVSPSLVQALVPGRTSYFRNGTHVSYTNPNGETALACWDQWAANRVAQRDTATAKLLSDTGLKEPIPGLTQLAGQGKFIDCPGYGKCWQPPAPPADAKPRPAVRPGDPNSMSSLLQPDPNAAATDANGNPTVKKAPKKTYTGNAPYPNTGGIAYTDLPYFPCGPDAYYYNIGLRTGMYAMGGYGMGGYGMGGYGMGGYGYWMASTPWNWAVCHSGSWIYQQNQYLWVPGQMRHHQPPVRWVRGGGGTGWVPIHPHDVQGKPPLNGGHGIVPTHPRNGAPGDRDRFNPGGNFKVLDSPPKDFRRPSSPTLTRADAPRMEAHMIRPGETLGSGPHEGQDRSGAHVARGQRDSIAGTGGESGAANTLRTGSDHGGAHGTVASVPIVFDHRSQSFMTEHQVTHGGSLRTVTEPVGSYLARSGGSFGGQQGDAAGPRSGPGFNPRDGGTPGYRGGGILNGGVDPRGGRGGLEGGLDATGGGGPRGGGGGYYPGSGNLGGGNSGGASPGGGNPGSGSFGGGARPGGGNPGVGGFGGGGGGSAPVATPSAPK